MAHKKEGWKNKPRFTNCCSEKEPIFQFEYFSALNWREAKKLIGKMVEFSDGGDDWNLGVLTRLDSDKDETYRFVSDDDTGWIYCRTCLKTFETSHPTITIDGVELPRPEMKVPKNRVMYWIWKPGKITEIQSTNGLFDKELVADGRVHLTKDRAQAWADWWQVNVVINKCREEKQNACI